MMHNENNRTIHLAHIVYQLGLAGKENTLLKIVRAMDSKRFKVDIIVLNSIHTPHLLNMEKVSVKLIGGGRRGVLRNLQKLITLFREEQYDIVFTHSWNTLVEGVCAAKIARTPVVLHGEHGTLEHTIKNRWIQRLLWRQATQIVFVADALRKKAQKLIGYKGDNFAIIYNGVDTSVFKPDIELRKRIRKQKGWENNFVIGHMGRFFPVKDHPTLVRAFSLAQQVYPDLKLALIGGGGEVGKSGIKKIKDLIIKLNIEDSVELIEPTAHPQAYYNAFDVFVLSSLSEGCSNVLLEAMACGKAVIATNVGGNPELITTEKNGLLVPPQNPEALSDAILRLRKDEKLRRELSTAASQVANRKFSLQKCVNNYQQLFLHLFSEKKVEV